MSDNEKEESPINVDLEVDELDEKEEKPKSEEPETENGNGVPRKRVCLSYTRRYWANGNRRGRKMMVSYFLLVVDN